MTEKAERLNLRGALAERLGLMVREAEAADGAGAGDVDSFRRGVLEGLRHARLVAQLFDNDAGHEDGVPALIEALEQEERDFDAEVGVTPPKRG